MSADDAVVRLVASDEESTEVRALLEAGIADEVADYDYGRGLSAHLIAIGAPPVGSGASGGPAAPPPGVSIRAASLSSKTLVAWIGAPLAAASVAAALVFMRAHAPPDAGSGASESRAPASAESDRRPNDAVGAHPGGDPPASVGGSDSEPGHAAPPETQSRHGKDDPRTGAGTDPLLGDARGARTHGVARPRRGPRGELLSLDEDGTSREPGRTNGEPRPSAEIVRSFPEGSEAASPEAPRTVVRAESAPSSKPAVVDAPSEEEAERERQARADARRAAENRLDREMEELMRAKRALSSDPKLALDLARHGEAEFRRSLLSEERQHVLLLALIALGRVTEAEQLAAPYLAKHPDSPFARRVRTALEAASKRGATR